jgi:hypothetical protein
MSCDMTYCDLWDILVDLDGPCQVVHVDDLD